MEPKTETPTLTPSSAANTPTPMAHERVIQPPPSSTPSNPLAIESAPAIPVPLVGSVQPQQPDQFNTATSTPLEQSATTNAVMQVPVVTLPPVPVAAAAAPAVSPAAVNGVVSGGEVTENPVQLGNAKKSYLKIIGAISGVVFLLGGGSAAAYMGVVVPNKPENVLSAAVVHTLKQTNVNYSGDANGTPTDGVGMAFKSTFSGSTDLVSKTAQGNIDATVSGANLKAEYRYVDKNAYFKVGDLKSVASAAGALSPELSTYVEAIGKEVSNKWIVVDSTLLESAGVSCVVDTKLSLTDEDIKLLKDSYTKNQFSTIKSSSSDVVDSKKVLKLNIEIDDDKFVAAGKDTDKLSFVKALKKCDKTNPANTSTDLTKGDHDKTPLTVWVNKKTKEIVQVSAESTDKDIKKDKMRTSVTIKLDYKKIPVTKPSTATPVTEIMANLQKSMGGQSGLESILGGSGSSTLPTDAAKASPTSSKIKSAAPAKPKIAPDYFETQVSDRLQFTKLVP